MIEKKKWQLFTARYVSCFERILEWAGSDFNGFILVVWRLHLKFSAASVAMATWSEAGEGCISVHRTVWTYAQLWRRGMDAPIMLWRLAVDSLMKAERLTLTRATKAQTYWLFENLDCTYCPHNSLRLNSYSLTYPYLWGVETGSCWALHSNRLGYIITSTSQLQGPIKTVLFKEHICLFNS